MTDILPDTVLDQLFRSARTYNSYTDRPVAEATLRDLYDLMKWGPTSLNQQPTRIAWCVSAEAKNRLAALTAENNAAKIRAAPVTAIIAMDLAFHDRLPEVFPHADMRPLFAGKDAVIADSAFRNSTLQGAYLIIAARALGLGVGPMSGIDKNAIDAAFFADTTIRTNFVATIGYGDPATVRARLPRLSFDDATTMQ